MRKPSTRLGRRPESSADGSPESASNRIAGADSGATSRPRRVHFNRFAGEPLPPNTRLVTRPGKYGNPYKVGDPLIPDNETAARVFRGGLVVRREFGVTPRRLRGYPSDETIRAELGGQDVACTCHEGEPCHGDTLVEVANP